MTIIPIAVAAVAGFVGGYNSRAPNHPVEVAVARSPEIRRAIPVEPEIRKAIPVQTRKPQVDRRSDSMAFISPGRASRAILQHGARMPTRSSGKQVDPSFGEKRPNEPRGMLPAVLMNLRKQRAR